MDEPIGDRRVVGCGTVVLIDRMIKGSQINPDPTRTLAARHDLSAWANAFCKKANIQAVGYREDIAS
jgi:hypothetical protein